MGAWSCLSIYDRTLSRFARFTKSRRPLQPFWAFVRRVEPVGTDRLDGDQDYVAGF